MPWVRRDTRVRAADPKEGENVENTKRPVGDGYPVALTDLLAEVADRGGSDLHISVGRRPTMRKNGVLAELDSPVLRPVDTQELVYSIMSEEQRDRFERHWDMDFACSIPGVARYRINAYYQRGSIGAACRYLPPRVGDFAALGIPEIMSELAVKPRGLVLVTGPAGSGKTTTLASVIDYINQSQSVHIITIEDPLEYLHTDQCSIVTQREVGADTKSFAEAVRYVLRQDPDIVVVGEMRDLATISAALTAAETGHLVFATLHTQDSAQTIDRIIDVFPHDQQQQVRVQLAGTIQGIVSQELLPNADGTGRVLVCEVLIPTAGVRNLIREAKTQQLPMLMQTGKHLGMTTMDESLADKHRQGLISYDMAMTQAHDPGVLRMLLESARR
jgi:twitching motility protein PilT